MKPRLKWHVDVTDDAVLDACHRANTSTDNPGFCIACGAEADGVEPDAEAYTCEGCGKPEVYGCDMLLLEIA